MFNLLVSSGFVALGDLFYEASDFQNTIANYMQAIQFNPDDVKVYLKR